MKKIFVLAPILPQWSEIESIAASLNFLTDNYEFCYLDPLSCMKDAINRDQFIAYWREKLAALYEHYDALIGFSLGGVILQKCFDIFRTNSKPIILFSTPSFSDQLLSARLSEIIELVKNNRLVAAISKLNEYVFHPYNPPAIDVAIPEPKQVSERLAFGFDLVIRTDSRQVLEETTTTYLHLIGANSQLVNRANVLAPPSCQLIEIPEAGMRVLQNKPDLCINPIKNFLRENIR